jgi:hypothetical protein
MKSATVVFDGAMEAAEELDFEAVKEGWAEYAVEGGVTIKMKNVVSRVFKLLNRTKPDGSPFYVLEGAAVVTTFNPSVAIIVNQSTQQPTKEN